MANTTRTQIKLPAGKRVLVVLTLLGYVALLNLYSTFIAPWASPDGQALTASVPSALSAVGLALILHRGKYSPRSIALSSLAATLIFLLTYALTSELANPGPDFIGAILTRILFYFIVTGHAVVSFTLCMLTGAIVRFLYLDPNRKNQRYR
jgi:hypothetical protein